VDVDRRGRLVVSPIHEIFVAAPSAVLGQDADDGVLGEAIVAALAESEEEAVDADRVRRSYVDGLRDNGIKPGELDRSPGVGVTASGATVNLHGWRPVRLGREPADERDLAAEASAEELGRAVRELLTTLGEPVPVPEGPTGAPFAYKMAWICVREGDPQAVAGALGLAEVEEATWEQGLAAAHRGDDAVFVSPPTGGWVFAVNVEWIDDAAVLAALSDRLGAEVQFFGTHRVVEAHAWARAQDGQLVRRLQWVGDQGEAVAEGEPTEVERRLGLDWILPEPGEPPDWDSVPDEESVLEVAEAWSVDPRSLDLVPVESEIGLLGRRPSG
jgi:hypothetical protein